MVSLISVTYLGEGLSTVKDDLTESPYPATWSDKEPNEMNPIAYHSGSRIKIKAKFDLSCSGFNSSKIRIQPYLEPTASTPGMKFPIRKPEYKEVGNSKYELEYPESESNIGFVENQIAYVEHFSPKWRITYDGINWEEISNYSSNELYVTWKKPALENISSNDRYVLLHTLFHLTCKPYNGITITDIADLTGSIWKLFDKDNLLQVHQNTNLYRRKDNLPLKYYGTYTTGSVNCPNLIKTGDGQCNSFAQLFLQMLRIQGYIDVNTGTDVLVVRFANN